MRLIDAEKYPCNDCGVSYCYKNCEKFDKWLEGCDYDVEAKVAELESIKTGGDCRNKCKYYDWSVGWCEGHCEDYVRDTAIEIIRRKE